MPTKATRPAYRFVTALKAEASSLHGMHQEAQKLRTTGNPRNSARVSRPSSSRGRNALGKYSRRSDRTGSANSGAGGFFPWSIFVTNDAPLLVPTRSQI